MTLLSFARRLAARAAALLVVLGGSAAANAADVTPAPAAGPVYVGQPLGGPNCPTCNGGAAAAGGCSSCGKACGVPLFGGKKKAPYVVQLCPGACFGYFQTQWHRWEDVCPLPYQGVGQSDAPRPSPGYVAPGTTGTPLPQPYVLPETKPAKPEARSSDAPPPAVIPTPGAPGLPTPTTIPGKPN